MVGTILSIQDSKQIFTNTSKWQVDVHWLPALKDNLWEKQVQINRLYFEFDVLKNFTWHGQIDAPRNKT